MKEILTKGLCRVEIKVHRNPSQIWHYLGSYNADTIIQMIWVREKRIYLDLVRKSHVEGHLTKVVT